VSRQLPDGGIELSPADIEALEARWSLSWTPSEVAQRLAGITAPWCVAAGWALDLFRGRQTREHGDIIQHTEDGIPYLAPELVLLFKAKHIRSKDQADFDESLPGMTPRPRGTLAGLLARVYPGHPWLAAL
jgi:hypothetical protein